MTTMGYLGEQMGGVGNRLNMPQPSSPMLAIPSAPTIPLPSLQYPDDIQAPPPLEPPDILPPFYHHPITSSQFTQFYPLPVYHKVAYSALDQTYLPHK